MKHGDGRAGFGLFDIGIDGNVTASVIRYTYFQTELDSARDFTAKQEEFA